MDSPTQGALRLWPVAVRAEGRRAASLPVLDEGGATSAGVALPGAAPDVVLLDHAGPRAAAWSAVRALGAEEIPEAETGRRPRRLDDAEWAELAAAYARAAATVVRAGRHAVLGVDDDGLLQSALSPRTGSADDQARLARVLAIHRACGPLDVALCVEELAPGGLDPTDGLEAARALAAQGARTLYVSAGSRAFPPLLTRTKGESVGDAGLALRSAAWLVGRVPARIVAVCAGDRALLLPRARSLGLDDVVAREAP